MFVRRTEYDKSGQSELDEKTRGAPLDEQTWVGPRVAEALGARAALQLVGGRFMAAAPGCSVQLRVEDEDGRLLPVNF